MSETQAKTAMDVLETLAGVAPLYKCKVNGVETVFHIKQIKTGKIPKLVKAAGGMIFALTNPTETKFEVASLLTMYTDESLDVLAVLLEVDRSVVDELELDDTLALLGSCLEVNVDFFVQRVLPSLSKGLTRLLAEVKAKNPSLLAGLTPPNT